MVVKEYDILPRLVSSQLFLVFSNDIDVLFLFGGFLYAMLVWPNDVLITAKIKAIMYLLCFRMRFMVLIPRLKLQLRLLNLEEILMHPLSPLKVTF
ncbi:hypothetical protein LIER_15277 [Lithospermum erythrorhizon]|uniref:Uncharacterized protein n=1 Tax=Lithospermum erythrorhizon TaxID=34254 RepID=A0AAV3Q3R5_LITER